MLYTAALILVATGVLHSYLGEVRILSPLFALPPQGVMKSGRVRGILRGAWHITSVAWLGLALVLVFSAGTTFEPVAIWTIAAVGAATAIACLLSWGPTHPGFVAFTICTALLLAHRLV